MQKLKPFLIPLILFVLSFALRLSLISKGPYHLDTLNLLIQSERTLETFRIHYLFGSGYPFTVVLAAFFIFILKLFSVTDPVFSVNFMSVVFGSLCIPALYVVVKKLFDEKTALFSTVIFSVFPIFLALSTYGKSHTPSLFLLLLGINFLLVYKNTSQTKHLIFSGLCIGLMGATRTQDMILMMIPLSFLYFSRPQGSHQDKSLSFKHFLVFCSLILAVVFLFHLPLVFRAKTSHYNVQLSAFWIMGLTRNFIGPFSESLPRSLSIAAFNFTVGGLTCSLIGLLLSARTHKKTFIFLLLWLVVTIFFYGNLRTTVPRLLILSFVPLIITEGYLFSRIFAFPSKVKYAGVLVFAVIAVLSLSNVYPELNFRHRNALLPDFVKWLAGKTETNALIVTGDETLFVQYFGNRATTDQLNSLYAPLDEEKLKGFKNKIDAALDQNIPVYITSSGLISNNPDRIFPRYVLKTYDLTRVGTHLTETWHYGATYHQVGNWSLFRISKK